MFSHVFIGVSDFDRALTFYDALMAALHIERRFCDRTRPWAGWQTTGGPRPLFLIGKPYDGQAHHHGNGQMVALLAANREVVRTAYGAALAHGATPEGSPGLRPE